MFESENESEREEERHEVVEREQKRYICMQEETRLYAETRICMLEMRQEERDENPSAKQTIRPEKN